MRTLILAMLLLIPVSAKAAYQPWVCPASGTGMGVTGNVSSVPLFTPPSTGWYDVRVYISPGASVVLGSAAFTVTYTENGVARTMTGPSMSVATLAAVPVPALIGIPADAAPVAFSIASTVGNYNYRVCYRQSAS